MCEDSPTLAAYLVAGLFFMPIGGSLGALFVALLSGGRRNDPPATKADDWHEGITPDALDARSGGR